jgi:hypothetical protein
MSIRVRLTLWYSILLAVVLSIFSIVLYSAISFRLNSDLDSELDTRRDQVEAVVQEAVRREPLLFLRTGRVSLPQSIDIFSSPGIGVQVLRASDGVCWTPPAILAINRCPTMPPSWTPRAQVSPSITPLNPDRARGSAC